MLWHIARNHRGVFFDPGRQDDAAEALLADIRPLGTIASKGTAPNTPPRTSLRLLRRRTPRARTYRSLAHFNSNESMPVEEWPLKQTLRRPDMFGSDLLTSKREICARTCGAPDSVEYDGSIYIRNIDDYGHVTKYYSRRDGEDLRFLHRDMFQDHQRRKKGKDWKIPGGMHIHHRNGDALTNYIGNFEMLTENEHDRVHAEGIPAIEYPDTIGQQYICETCPHRIKRRPPAAIVHPDDTRRHPRRARELILKEATPENVRRLEEHGVVWDSRPARLDGGAGRFTTKYAEMADRVRALFPDMLA